MKSILVVLALGLLVLVGAGAGGFTSGLRGTVVIEPASPVCKTGTPCTRPAAHMTIRFWRHGRVVAHTRTDSRGKFRMALDPRTYRVTAKAAATVKPGHVTVATGRYRRVTFKLDIGIR
jgi:hypothetical protein